MALTFLEVNIADNTPSRAEFHVLMVNGIEGISMPYSYDLTLVRPGALPDVNPKRIVNTRATLGIRREEGKDPPLLRMGIIEHFEKAGFGTKNDDLRVYSARMVPPFKMLDREVVFRVFENMDVVGIIDTVLRGVPHLQIDTGLLRQDRLEFPKMEYCVQFGESTFGFLSRLMNRFGIHYYFDTRGDPEDIQNELMVFGIARTLDAACRQPLVDIVADNDLDDRADAVAGFVQRFDPVFRSSKFGNFNPLAPTKFFTATRKIDPGFDLSSDTAGPALNFKSEAFPVPVFSSQDAAAYAERFQKHEEANVASIAGRSKNRTFTPGRNIFIKKDFIHARDNDTTTSLDGHTFLLSWVSFSAFEPNVGQSTPWKTIGEFFRALYHGESAAEVTNAFVIGTLKQYLESQQEVAWDRAFHHKREKAPHLISQLLTGGISQIAEALGSLVSAISSVIELNEPKFHCSFVARAATHKVPLALPPTAPRPIAHGPHLATVIGKHGADTTLGDISADALGRVRVRFPWDPGPPLGDDPFVVGDPYATGRNTCWLRVAQNWAGRAFGVQFLPRVGNEVVVEFIDGDPERPIITGSIYNADQGKPNLPFAAFKDGPRPFKAEDLLAHTEVTTFERSGIKTSIVPTAGGKGGFHLLRFDDTRGGEQIVLRSQGRLDITAFRSQFRTVHGNKHTRVKALEKADADTEVGASGASGSSQASSGGSSFTTVAGEYDLHIGAERYEAVEKEAQLTVKADTANDLQANQGTIVGQTATLNATKIVLEAQAKITLKVGGSFVVIDPCGVSISGPLVKINSGGSPDSAADLEFVDPADAIQADPGEPDNFLELQPKHTGSGGRRKRSVKAKHGLVCSANPDGTIQVTKAVKVDASDPAYAEAVIADLSTIAATQAGKKLLDDLDASGKSVQVNRKDPPPSPPNAFARPLDRTAASDGTGSDSTVDYNPDQWPDPSTRTQAPGDVILFHELQHAEHNARGTRDTTARSDNFTNNEEFNTIEAENKYRDERGVPRRNDHTDL